MTRKEILEKTIDFDDAINRIVRLEKENAELSMKRKAERKIFQGIVEKKNDQLTKAKEIIEKLLEEEKNNMYWEMNGSDKSSYYEVRKQAEQFLSEVETKIKGVNYGFRL